MKNVKIFIGLILSFLIINTTAAFADTTVKVFVNGKEINFTDAKPQIIDSRTMVPIRAAAEALNMEVSWDKASETATFTKGSDVITHKMNSTQIIVNGTPKNFDYRSVNVSNRILMPIRMLAEATGAAVEWNKDTRTVSITAADPAIVRVTGKTSEIKAGSEIEAAVIANGDTTAVKVTDTSGKVLTEFSKYTINQDNTRNFDIGWTIPEGSVGDVKYKVYAGNADGYSETAYDFSCKIAEDNTPKIIKFGVDEDMPEKDDKIEFTVRTNDKATRIKIESDYLESNKIIEKFEEDGSERIFKYTCRMSTRGSYDFDIFVGDDKEYAKGCETIKIDIGKSKDSSSKKNNNGKLEINDIVTNCDVISYGEEVTVSVYTSTNAEMVEIFDDDDNRVARTSSTRNKTSDEYIWELSFEIRHSGSEKYYVIVTDEDDEEEKESFKIEGEKYSSGDLYIINLIEKSSSMNVGDSAKFTVKTTDIARKIEVKDSSGDLLDTKESTGGQESWDVSFKLSKSIASKGITVYAYDKDNNVTSKKFYLSLDEEEDPEINDVDIEDEDVDYRDDIEITVYTNKAVTKVWVEDEEEERVAKTSKHTTEDNEYVWELSFEATERGRCSYIVYAENDNDETDEYKIKVNVSK